MSVRTLKQARAFVLRAKICGIFSSPAQGVQCLWDIVDLPHRKPGALRAELGMKQRPERSRFDRALQELQTTLDIARRNSFDDENDTWVPFSEQYLDVVRRERPEGAE
jgi:hypothetical protein